MDAKQELIEILKGFASHTDEHQEMFKTAQRKKTYRGGTYESWLNTCIIYWTRHYNRKYNTRITIGEAKLFYADLLKNYKPDKVQLEMKR
tara:strand:+ start:3476 stop:3745 length:270 start_codon:yes stop_codon:yes gene_type:complete